MACSDRVSGSHAEVLRFLLELSERVAPLAKKEAKVLLARKEAMESKQWREQGSAGLPDKSELQRWDQDFYVSKLRGMIQESVLNKEALNSSESLVAPLRPYITLGNLVRGISFITETVFGARLVRQPLKPGEDWSGGGG